MINFLYMNFFIIIFLGILPSFVWLLFFLRKDIHPEPKSMILKVFLLGALSAMMAVFSETGFQEILFDFNLFPGSVLFFILYWFLGVGAIEEVLKYLVVRLLILSHHEFDEPTDAMLYMIISGLGFAALENILIVISQTILNKPFGETLFLVLFRFLTAVFLHALCSALIGYFLALSIYNTRIQFRLISIGLSFGVVFHAFFNIAVTKIDDSLIELGRKIVILDHQTFNFFSVMLFAILVGLAFFVIRGFRELKKMQSVCKI